MTTLKQKNGFTSLPPLTGENKLFVPFFWQFLEGRFALLRSLKMTYFSVGNRLTPALPILDLH